MAEIRKLYASDKRKKVTTIRNQHLEEFITALNTVQTKQCKAELPKGVDITHWVGGKILLRLFTKSRGWEDHLIAEIRARMIKMSKKQEKYLSIIEKRGVVRRHEHARLWYQNTIRQN